MSHLRCKKKRKKKRLQMIDKNKRLLIDGKLRQKIDSFTNDVKPKYSKEDEFARMDNKGYSKEDEDEFPRMHNKEFEFSRMHNKEVEFPRRHNKEVELSRMHNKGYSKEVELSRMHNKGYSKEVELSRMHNKEVELSRMHNKEVELSRMHNKEVELSRMHNKGYSKEVEDKFPRMHSKEDEFPRMHNKGYSKEVEDKFPRRHNKGYSKEVESPRRHNKGYSKEVESPSHETKNFDYPETFEEEKVKFRHKSFIFDIIDENLNKNVTKAIIEEYKLDDIDDVIEDTTKEINLYCAEHNLIESPKILNAYFMIIYTYLYSDKIIPKEIIHKIVSDFEEDKYYTVVSYPLTYLKKYYGIDVKREFKEVKILEDGGVVIAELIRSLVKRSITNARDLGKFDLLWVFVKSIGMGHYHALEMIAKDTKPRIPEYKMIEIIKVAFPKNLDLSVYTSGSLTNIVREIVKNLKVLCSNNDMKDCVNYLRDNIKM